MYETHITVVGNVATPIDKDRLSDGTIVANFRVGSTERRYDRASGGWVDGERLFVDVRCWRKLAENAAGSLVKGDPVVVTGKIYTRSYEHEGQRRTAVSIDAHTVAADLSRCTAVVTRDRRQATAQAGSGADGEHDGAAAARGAAARGDGGSAADRRREPDPGRDGGWRASGLVAAVPAGEG